MPTPYHLEHGEQSSSSGLWIGAALLGFLLLIALLFWSPFAPHTCREPPRPRCVFEDDNLLEEEMFDKEEKPSAKKQNKATKGAAPAAKGLKAAVNDKTQTNAEDVAIKQVLADALKNRIKFNAVRQTEGWKEGDRPSTDKKKAALALPIQPIKVVKA